MTVTSPGHNYIGHTYVGRAAHPTILTVTSPGRNYISHKYVGRTALPYDRYESWVDVGRARQLGSTCACMLACVSASVRAGGRACVQCMRTHVRCGYADVCARGSVHTGVSTRADVSVVSGHTWLYIVMAFILMAYILMAYVAMAYTAMPDIVMAYIVMARRVSAQLRARRYL